MKKVIHISYSNKISDLGTVSIPGSKSESNRAQVINALCTHPGTINNLSSARDTHLMTTLLASKASKIDVKDAGTVMRFLTTYFALTNQTKQITGTQRMQERPIKILVKALQTLGSKIEYLKKEGYPPLQINGFPKQVTNQITIDGSVSSQYLSALLMLAPTLPMGIKLKVATSVTSKPYLQMTTNLMRHFGVKVTHQNNHYNVKPQPYSFHPFYVEPDWSSASYWYSIFVLSGASKLVLKGYKEHSYQGDSALTQLMEPFGVHTQFEANNVVLTKKEQTLPETINFINNPDLAQTFAVLCTALNHPCKFTGLHTLKIKETNRVAAIKNELQKLRADFIEENNSWQVVPPQSTQWKHANIHITTYNDHRMAMAFAPLACVCKGVYIEDPEVVNKSYPSFWDDLAQAGFSIALVK